jgi:ribosomal protein S18 acetylase RimI-like enzyme
MQNQVGPVQVREVSVAHRKSQGRFEGLVFTGPGREVVEQIGRETSQSSAAVLDSIVRRLLVKKGADWTGPILSEYLGLYDESSATFALVWDRSSRQLVAHGCVVQSRAQGGAGLIAHIRTDDACQGLGLGTLVTAEVTQAAFQKGAQVVVLGTDDKRYRIEQGEKAACGMYARLGYAILAEKELTDTIEWLMVVHPQLFQRCQQVKTAASGRFPAETPQDVRDMQQALVDSVRQQFSRPLSDGDCPGCGKGDRHLMPERPDQPSVGARCFAQKVPVTFSAEVSPVGQGDLANLFLLMNLCPPHDFQIKAAPWGVQLGPEMERCFLVDVRPAIADCDRLEDASLALRDRHGAILAVCAAKRLFPFTRNAMQIDFYCLPRFYEANQPAVAALVEAVLARIDQSPQRSHPCRMLFSGVDQEKIQLFQELGFFPTSNIHPYFTADGKPAFTACELERVL